MCHAVCQRTEPQGKEKRKREGIPPALKRDFGAYTACVVQVCLMFFLIFAILGTQLFMGLFGRCAGCLFAEAVVKAIHKSPLF